MVYNWFLCVGLGIVGQLFSFFFFFFFFFFFLVPQAHYCGAFIH